MSRIPLILLIVVCAFTKAASAQVTLTVPGMFADPQLAMSFAASGDTILVSPGVYPVVLEYFGRSVNVVSTDGPEVTTLAAALTFIAPVCFIQQETSGAILDGFTIAGGSTGSAGGGINVGFAATPTIRNCIITGNSSFGGGGGVGVQAGANPLIVNTIIRGNSAPSGQGGAIFCATMAGALPAGQATLRNCTITGNTASSGSPSTDVGGIFCATGAACALDSTILWGNADLEFNSSSSVFANYSIVEGGNGSGGPFPGAQNIDADPLFVDAATGNVDVMPGSPAFDGANPALSQPATDCTGSPRVVNFAADIGAEELLNLYPGSEEDLEVRTSVNGVPDIAPTLSATSTDAYIVQLLSPNGTYDGTIPLLMAQAFVTGTPPAPFPTFPEFHVDPGMPILLLYDGTNTPPFGVGLLPVGGLTFAYTVPAAAAGATVRIQGLVLAANPNNMFFTASNAHELRIL